MVTPRMVTEAERRARAIRREDRFENIKDVETQAAEEVAREEYPRLPVDERRDVVNELLRKMGSGTASHPDDGRTAPGSRTDWDMFGGGRR